MPPPFAPQSRAVRETVSAETSTANQARTGLASAVDHGQAHARAGDRGADGDARGIERAGDRHVQVAALLDALIVPMAVTMPVNIQAPSLRARGSRLRACRCQAGAGRPGASLAATPVGAGIAEGGDAVAEQRRRAVEQQPIDQAGREKCLGDFARRLRPAGIAVRGRRSAAGCGDRRSIHRAPRRASARSRRGLRLLEARQTHVEPGLVRSQCAAADQDRVGAGAFAVGMGARRLRR